MQFRLKWACGLLGL